MGKFLSAGFAAALYCAASSHVLAQPLASPAAPSEANTTEPDHPARGWIVSLYCGLPLTNEAASKVAKESLNFGEGNLRELGLGLVVRTINLWICKGMPSLDGIWGMVE